MKHSVSKRKGFIILKIEETVFDVRHASTFSQSIEKFLQKKGSKHMIFDFSPVKAIDSSGIGSMLLAHRKANQSDGLAIFVSLCQQIKDLLKLSCLDKQLYIFSSLNEVMTLIEHSEKHRKAAAGCSSSKKAEEKNDDDYDIDLEKQLSSTGFNADEIIDETEIEEETPEPLTPQKKRGRPKKTIAPAPLASRAKK